MGMKFIRGLIYPNPNSSGRGWVWRLKWAYEFWGFCVNGTSSLTVPGGFANNGVNFPTNFTNGTSLMTSGSDGSHPVVAGNQFSGDCVFTSASGSFTSAMVGKALVMWKENSDSSEDSIYLITQVLSSTQIIININTGGTPHVTTKHPSMTVRTNVNFRVVDMVTGSDAGYVNGAFLVFQMDASSINPGQGNSQFSTTIQWDTSANAASTNGNAASLIAAGLSGSGSWNGNTLTVSSVTGAGVSPIVVTTTAPHGFTTGQQVNISGVNGNTNCNGMFTITTTGANTFSLTGGLAGVQSGGVYTGGGIGTTTGNGTYTSGGTVWNAFQNDGYSTFFAVNPNTNALYSGGQTAITMIADKTFFINHCREQDLFQSNLQCHWHWEIPTRLYPQGQDLHPMTALYLTTNGLLINQTNNSYSGGFVMRTHSSDTITNRPYRTLVKALRGDGTPDVFGSLSDYRVGYNTITGTIPISDALLCLPGVSNQYSLARVRLRTVKFTGTHVPKHHRIGLNGEFIQMQNGICWPWDNTIIPFQLLQFGV